MKFNWGTGIFLFYTFFALSLVYQVYRSTQYDHSLVVEDYYAKDLTYQSTMNKLKNSKRLKTPLQIKNNNTAQEINLVFPSNIENIKGSVLLYRASSKKEDVLLPIKIGAQNQMNIYTKKLIAGRWKVEVDWEGDHQKFLDRKTINVTK